MPEIREYTPARLHSLTPYLATNDPAAAIAWYPEVFDAVLLGDPIVMPDGRIGHAEMRVGDTRLHARGRVPRRETTSARRRSAAAPSASCSTCPTPTRRTRSRSSTGATALRPIAESYGARGGTIRDPFGHRWFVQTAIEADDVPVEDVPGRRYGDIGYLTLMFPTATAPRAFYGALFDWQLDAGTSPARSTSRRSPRRPASTGGPATPEVAPVLPGRRHRGGRGARARARRRGALGHRLRLGRQRRVRRRPGSALRPLPPPARLLTRTGVTVAPIRVPCSRRFGG